MIVEGTRRPLRVRIFLYSLIALLPILLCTIVAIETFIVPSIITHARQELTNTTLLLKGSIETGATIAVRNHLKAIAEKNREIIFYHLALFEKGTITKEELLNRVRSILFSQQIGSSGYIYAIDSRGIAVVHPNDEVEGTVNTRFSFVEEQIERKEGYIEYEWQNPGEKAPRPKALYMVYLEPLDWILSVTSYRDEFKQLVDTEDFRGIVLSLRFDKSGYAYVFDQQGNTLIHPKLKNFNALQREDLPNEFIQKMIETGSGSIEYEWQNPNEEEPRKKIAVYETLPEYGWIVVSSSYLDEVLQPAGLARILAYCATILLLAAAALLSYLLSGRVTRPVDAMIRQLDKNARDSTLTPLPVTTKDELGRLASEFNHFLEVFKKKNEELRHQTERYHSLFETSPDAVFLVRETVIIDCNSTTLTIFAGERHSLIGRSLLDLLPLCQPDGTSSKDLVKAKTRQAFEQSSALQSFECIHMRLDGRLFNAEVRIKSFGMDKDEYMLVGFVRDITARKEAEDALRQSEIKYRHLLEHAEDVIFIEKNGIIVYGNSKAASLLGYSFSELNGLSLHRIIRCDTGSIVGEDGARSSAGKDELPLSCSCAMVKKDGTSRDVQLNRTLIEWEGEPATLNFLRDITEQKKLESVLQQAQKMDAIGTLAGGIAHDFNNILMGIQGRVSLMTAEQEKISQTADHLQAIEQYVESASGLTRQLLGFARGGKYQPKPTDLNELVDSSSAMYGRTRKEIEIILEKSETLVVSDLDRQQIEQVLLNMYVNAWQAMPNGGKLYLRTSIVRLNEQECQPYGKSPGNYAKITVEDTGSGMEESIQQQIFDPFFTTKEKERGTGLGLASAYGIINNHNGFITVDSEVGRGTTFTIYLPESQTTPEKSLPKQTGIISGQETILLIDDEEIILDVGTQMLEQLGYQVIPAHSGQAALDQLKESVKTIDLVILDSVMPGMDGKATLEELRHIDSSIPVILSSGYAIDDVASKVIAENCSAFIQKPFSLTTLSQTLRKVLDGEK